MAESRYRGTRRELYEVGEERRGRPRQNRVKIFLKMDGAVHRRLLSLRERFPLLKASQSELVGLGVDLVGQRLAEMAVALGRDEGVLPAGVVDLEALYLFWNLEIDSQLGARATTIYLSPEQAVRLSEIRARLRLQIHVSQSALLNLGVTLLTDLACSVTDGAEGAPIRNIAELSVTLKPFA